MLLSAGKIGAALGYRCLETFFAGDNIVHELGNFRRFFHFAIFEILIAISDIALDSAGEQAGFLRNITDFVPQVMLGHLPDIDIVDQDFAFGHIIKTGNQVDQRGLSAAGTADDGRSLPGSGSEGDSLQHIIFGAGIFEADILKLHHVL